MEQPAENELRIALKISKLIGETADLRNARERKITWVGNSENALRIEIDEYLSLSGEE